MIKNVKRNVCVAMLLGSSFFVAPMATAETIGFVGLSIDLNRAENEARNEKETETTLGLDAAVSMRFGDRNTFVFDALYRDGKFEGNIIDDDDMGPNTRLARTIYVM